jgi:hypothetical protein
MIYVIGRCVKVISWSKTDFRIKISAVDPPKSVTEECQNLNCNFKGERANYVLYFSRRQKKFWRTTLEKCCNVKGLGTTNLIFFLIIFTS